MIFSHHQFLICFSISIKSKIRKNRLITNCGNKCEIITSNCLWIFTSILSKEDKKETKNKTQINKNSRKFLPIVLLSSNIQLMKSILKYVYIFQTFPFFLYPFHDDAKRLIWKQNQNSICHFFESNGFISHERNSQKPYVYAMLTLIYRLNDRLCHNFSFQFSSRVSKNCSYHFPFCFFFFSSYFTWALNIRNSTHNFLFKIFFDGTVYCADRVQWNGKSVVGENVEFE